MGDPLVRILTLMLRAFMGVFVVLDNCVWLGSIKVVKFEDMKLLKKQANLFRWFAASFNLVLGLIDIQKQQKLETKLLSTDAGDGDFQKVHEKQGKNVIGLVKNCCDVLCYGISAEIIKLVTGGGELGEGNHAFLGTISGIAGGYAIWDKM